MPDVLIHAAVFTDFKRLTIEHAGGTHVYTFLDADDMRRWASEQARNGERDAAQAVLNGLSRDATLTNPSAWERVYPVTRPAVGQLRNLPGRP